MDFIERWLHISPDGGNGLSEVLILAVLIAIGLIFISLRNYFPKNLKEYRQWFGKRESSDRTDH